ncbi:MAG: hypothetical protein QM639_01365 [Rhodocyclaceae bacterium]
MRLFRSNAVVLACLALSACAGISQSGSWRDPQFGGPALKNVLVVAAGDAQTQRRIVEDTLSNVLRQWGVRAAVSYTAVDAVKGDNAAGIVGLPAVQAALRSAGADGALVVRVLRVDRGYNSGPSFGVGVGGGSGGWGGGWSGGGVGVSIPIGGGDGTSAADATTVEAAMTSMASGKLVWSATYSLNGALDAGAAAERLSRQIVTDLRKDAVI